MRDIVAQLTAMADPVKADEIESRLKTIREDAVRQLKDRQDLFVDGQNVIRLGKHAFSVNTQPLDLKLADTGNGDGLEFETGYAAEELNEYVAVLRKLFVVRNFILRNNLAYIHSAAQADEFRTEPAFKLQGSYRNMNKIAGKVVAIINEAELHATIISHYENEAQTLTTDAEANLLKFKELNGLQTVAEQACWAEIKTTFRKNQQFKGLASGDQMGQLMVQRSALGDGLHAIREVIAEGMRKSEP